MSRKSKNWEKICKMPKTAHERRECARRKASTATVPYPKPKKAEIYLAGPTTKKTPTGTKKLRWAKCAVPNFPAKSKFDQWSVLQRNSETMKNRPAITDSGTAYKQLKDMGQLAQEEFIAIYLNNRNKIVGTTVVSRGTATEVLVDPGDVLRPGLLARAKRFMVAHNHPSGDPIPTPQDIALTRRLKSAGEAVGLALLDSLVIGDGTYSSLRDLGLIT